MKVTVLVPDELHREVKAEVARRGDTVTRIVIEAFRRYLAEGDEWTRWEVALEQARQVREAQRARRGEWEGLDIASMVRESREHRTAQICQALDRD
ncbi:MAG TPA: hypothetical protein G4O02_04785 [Caldilineae bacterium]|nr:hypothetical protein [Caldilineae bacterium]